MPTRRFDLAAEPRDRPLRVAVGRAAARPDGPVDADALSPAERERATRFGRPQDAVRFVTARTLARRMLGARLGVAASQVDLVVPHPGWKPRVPGSTLDVSIAHAADLVLVAVADGAEIGVDVEGGPGVVRHVDEALWRSVTSPAERTAAGGGSWPSDPTPEAVDAFLRVWVRKEAVLKAVRVGLAVPMDVLTIRDGPTPSVAATPPELPAPSDLVVADLVVPDGLRAAVAAVTRRDVLVHDADTDELLARVRSSVGG